jgi:hypothetical protein
LQEVWVSSRDIEKKPNFLRCKRNVALPKRHRYQALCLSRSKQGNIYIGEYVEKGEEPMLSDDTILSTRVGWMGAAPGATQQLHSSINGSKTHLLLPLRSAAIPRYY